MSVFKVEVANSYLYSRPCKLQPSPTDTNIHHPPNNNHNLNLKPHLQRQHPKLSNPPTPHTNPTLPSTIFHIFLLRTKTPPSPFPDSIDPIELIPPLDSKLET